MPVPSSIFDLSTTPASNFPAGSESPSTIDDYLRAHAAIIRQVSDAKSNTSHNHAGVYEPADATILKDADIGVTVQAYDADIPTVAASQAEMEAGTQAALRSMSPLRVAQAIAALSSNLVAASTAEAQAGTSNAVAITPLRLREGLNASGSAPIYACRAWVNFNGTGTVAIRASGNVSSITDNGTGDYTVNFTTAMPDANYTVTGTGDGPNTTTFHNVTAVALTSAGVQVRLWGSYSATTVRDSAIVSVAIFR